MERSPIPHNDIDLVSAYLDRQMSAEERARLEARLATEEGLRELVFELGQTRELLRAAPRYRAPKNFTLTREMAGAKKISFWRKIHLNTYRWVSAGAAAALALTFFLQLTPGLAPTAAPASAPLPVLEMAADAAEQPAAKKRGIAEEPPIIVWNNVTAGGKGGGGGGYGGDVSAFAAAMPVTEDGVPMAEETPEATPEAEMSLQAVVPAEPLEGPGPILGVAATADQGLIEAIEPESSSHAAGSVETSAPADWRATLWPYQIGLAVLAAAAALAGFFSHRKTSN